MSIQSSFSANLRYAVAIEIPMETPIRCNTLDLDRALGYFLKKFQDSTLKRTQNELLSAESVCCIAKNLNASLEATYQDVYRLTIVLSFNDESLVETFIKRAYSELLVDNISIRYAITANLPMQYLGPLEKMSILATETSLRQTTKLTNNKGAKYDLDNAANLLNFAFQHEGQKIEAMYSINHTQPKLMMTISFVSQNGQKDFMEHFIN